MGTNKYISRLKAQLDQAIVQREHWKQLAENRNSIVVTEVCPESRSVEEYIIDADSVRASWRLIRGYREQIEALRAENGRLESAWQVTTLRRKDQIIAAQEKENDRVKRELEAARVLLRKWLDTDLGVSSPAINRLKCSTDYLLATTLAPEVQAEQDDGEARHDAVKAIHDVMAAVQCSSLYSLAEAVFDAGYLKAAEQGERQEAVAYLHTLHMELDQSQSVVSQSPHNPFGVRGENYDDAYSVTTEPLYTTAKPGPDVRALVEALEQIAAGERVVERDGFSTVENDTTIDYPGIAIAALAAHRQAQRKGESHES